MPVDFALFCARQKPAYVSFTYMFVHDLTQVEQKHGHL